MKIIKDFLIREIAGECILVPTGDTAKEFCGMISLSPSAQFIWDHIEGADSLNELISLITEEFDIDEVIARSETIEFIAELLNAGMIETTKEDRSW